MSTTTQACAPEIVVRGFLKDVRSGNRPDDAHRYLADVVLAHQLTGEQETTVRRTPADYADHVRAMIDDHGRFTLDVLTSSRTPTSLPSPGDRPGNIIRTSPPQRPWSSSLRVRTA